MRPPFTEEAVREVLRAAGFTEYDPLDPVALGFWVETFQGAAGAIIAEPKVKDLHPASVDGFTAWRDSMLRQYLDALSGAGYQASIAGERVTLTLPA
jgi:hypothetical protein